MFTNILILRLPAALKPLTGDGGSSTLYASGAIRNDH